MKKFTLVIAAILTAMAMTVSAFAVDLAYTDAKSPSYSYTVNGDITELTATVTILDFITADADGIVAADYWKDGAVMACDFVICNEAPDDEAVVACKALGAALV